MATNIVDDREQQHSLVLKLTLPLGLAEFVILSLLAVVVHAFALTFVFPKAYDPLWPNHSDYYIASSLAHTKNYMSTALQWPRPVGFFFFYITGFLGTRGAILCDLLLVGLNCVLTAMFVRRYVGAKFSPLFVAGVACYYFLIFTHPMQYIWSSYDTFSQLAYLFIISAFCLSVSGRFRVLPVGLIAASFLAKETYVLSLPVLLLGWLLGAKKTERRAPINLLLASAAGGVIALVFNLVVQSSFLGHNSTATSPYHVDLSPKSVVTEWLSYAGEGTSLWAWAYIAAVVVLILVFRRKYPALNVVGVVAFALAGLLAWGPNAVLPNHRISGYSFNGFYLIFAPVLVLGAMLAGLGRQAWAAGAALAACLLLPLSYKPFYKKNDWTLEQQHRQKNLSQTLQDRIAKLPKTTKTVLVTGINFPFNPFERPTSLYEYGDQLPAFDVVAYQPKPPGTFNESETVHFISPSEALQRKYDDVWIVGDDGASRPFTLSASGAESLQSIGVNPNSVAIFPAVAAALGLDQPANYGNPNLDGAHLLTCGTAYLSYAQPDAALQCLSASAAKIPESPYPYFFSGQAYEASGRLPEAAANFARAVALDDVKNPNPYFKDAVARVAARSTAAAH